MPKGKKKGKFEHRRTEQPYSSDEDAGIDMTIDNCSETSGQSDLKSNHEEAATKKHVFARGEAKSGSWLRNMACFGAVTNRPQSGTDIRFSSTNVSFKDIDTRARRRLRAKQNNDEASSHSDSDDDYERALKMHLTYDSPNPYEDEWSTETDEENYVEDEHVDVAHQGRPSLHCGPTVVDDAPETGLNREIPDETECSDKNEVQEKLEEKVLEIIDALSARANAARAAALVALRGALQRRHLAGVLGGQRATLADHVTRALRRGRDPERRAAAAVAPILALQIGEEGTEEFMSEVRPALAAAAVDKSASLDTRTECCSSLAVLCYLLEEDMSEILDILRMYETIFSGSYLKGDGSVKVSVSVVSEGGWHAAALDGWALLLGALEPRHARALLAAQPPGLARLSDMLEACSLEVRMAAGGALAIAHERTTEEDEDEEAAWGGEGGEVLARLTQLARDSHKYRAKRDRKLQRATFRDILKYFEEGDVPSLRVRVGTEVVECDTWSSRGAYTALAAALGAGLRPLLPHVSALRHALGLPAALPVHATAPAAKVNKLQRHLQNSAACKARTLARNKNRDKRSAALAP